jgi:hypothetical protein
LSKMGGGGGGLTPPYGNSDQALISASNAQASQGSIA